MLRTAINKLTAGNSVRLINTASTLYREKAFSEVKLLGRVGRDPKAHGPDSRQIVVFNVAVNQLQQPKVDDDSFAEKEITHWHNVVVLRPALQSYVLQHVTKGTRVLCSGRLENRLIRRGDSDEDEPSVYKLTNVVLEDLVLLARPQNFPSEELDDEETAATTNSDSIV